MNLVTLALVATTAIAGPALDAPKGDKTPAPRTTVAYAQTQYGETQKAGNGTIRTFVRKQADGKLAQVGLAFSEAALNSLATEDTSWSLALPQDATKANLQHVYFVWMPHGHEPDGVYNVPHFDCHFYLTSQADRMSIVENDPRLEKNPDAAFVPEKHLKVHPLPLMGAHWVDTTTPELNGKPFTTTFIFGSLDGQVTFLEPMFTLEFLKKVKGERFSVKQPAKVAKPGLYPTNYGFTYNAAEKQYEITLEDLVDRQ